MMLSAIVSLAAAQLAAAHFHLNYPIWRADSLANDSYSQWQYPCAGVDYGIGNVTDWPLDGGSLKLQLGHPWSYIFVNLGLGTNTSNFNLTLTPELHNETGPGNLCIEKLPIPEDIPDNTLASLQIVTMGESGNALYNCADIRLTSSAKTLINCTNDDGVSITTVKPVNGNSSDVSGGGSNSSDVSGGDASPDEDGDGAAGTVSVNKFTMAIVVGFGAVVGMGVRL